MANLNSVSVYQPFPEGFCHDDFWNWSLTWDTTDPDLTRCFQTTALVWAPCVFLWAALPVGIYHFKTLPAYVTKLTWKSASKMILSLLCAVIALSDVGFIIAHWINAGHDGLSVSELVAAAVKLFTYLLSAIYIYFDKKTARASSGVLFIFWLLSLLGGSVTFRSNIKQTLIKDETNMAFLNATQGICLIFITMQLLLSCLGERFKELETDEKNPLPETYASFLSAATFSWFSPMAYLGWRKPLDEGDMWTLPHDDQTRQLVADLEKNWVQEMEKIASGKKLDGNDDREPSFFKVLLKTYRLKMAVTFLYSIVHDFSVFITPQCLRLIIGFISDPSQPAWRGYFYAVLMLVGAGFQILALNATLARGFRLGLKVRASVAAMIYRKSLRMSSSAKRASSVGEVVNLMSVDAQRFTEFMAFIPTLWSAPIRMSLAMYFLYELVGNSVFVGLAVMLAAFVANAFLVSRVRGLHILQMKEKDGRIKIINEILNGIKVLKLYAWEASFQQLVTDNRNRELKTLKKAAYLSAIAQFIWILAPALVALATFATFTLLSTENILVPEKAFVAVTLLNILRIPLTLVPMALTLAIQSWIAVKRLAKFLQKDELKPDDVTELPPTAPFSVQVRNGAFSWGGSDPVTLKDINLTIKEGQLVAVVGQVGCGKSSLCSALLGLMEKRAGDVAVKGHVAYVPQQAWIQNLTIRENILFGKEMRKDRYQRTLDACSLRADLEILAGGDQTEIGERGTNLSGGQRQRVSLARAVFSDADVYILDDPLSAVDAHVGKHIFENVIGPNGILKKKTRILVTHGISFLPQTDLIIVVNNGIISESGTYRQLLHNGGAFSEFLRTYLTEDPDSILDEEDDPDAALLKEEILQHLGLAGPGSNLYDRRGSILSMLSRKSSALSAASGIKASFLRKEAKKNKTVLEKGKLIDTEKRETGAVQWSVYRSLAKQFSYRVAFGVAIFYGTSYAASVGANFWLSDWAKDSVDAELATDLNQRHYRLGVYSSFALIQGLFTLFSAFTLAYGRIRASRLTHESMLHRIMRAPMSFFDQTPLGRIVNRFSKDVDAIDTAIPATLDMWLYAFYSVVSTMIVISINVPPFIALLIPLSVFYYLMQRYFIATSRQLKRLESVTRSPVFSHFQESLAGSSVINATKQTDRFIRANEHLIDLNHAVGYPNTISQRWIAIRLDFVSICVTFFTAIFGVLGREYPALGVDSDQTALSISYALSLGGILSWFVRATSDIESNVVSVERIKEYAEVPIEPAWINDNNRPPANWPSDGSVHFNQYKTKYRPELDLVLRGVEARISSGEKIGIVGRTGAGKSSLTLALFRIIEASEGSITIDGINIAELGLHDLRSRLTILPQEPVLFSGTLRLNLDPFGKFNDTEVWLALENSHLKDFVSTLPGGLNNVVSDGGENYSVGQRQLICLARALLRKTKILILDEATAAIDLETDDLIQTTIREKFADCTILTIAHRINTIMDSTRIMVLDQGLVKEFGTPEKLLSDPSGIFYSLVKAADLNLTPAMPTILVTVI